MRRTFKEYEAMWEDAAANSIAGGGVSLPADAMGKQALLRRQKRKRYMMAELKRVRNS
jgi:hypothetical protein